MLNLIWKYNLELQVSFASKAIQKYLIEGPDWKIKVLALILVQNWN